MALDLLKSVTGRTLIESHRGSVGHAPENSWTAIKTGHQLGADLIEIDVQMSQDLVPFLRHNYQLPDGRWCNKLQWNELENIAIDGEPLPKLDDVLVWARETGSNLSLDIKTTFDTEGKLTQEVVKSLERTNSKDIVILLFVDHNELFHLKKAHPDIMTRALLRGRLFNYAEYLPAHTQVPITAPVKGHSKIIFLYVPDRITRAARIIKLPRLFFWHNLFLNRQRSAILVTACEFMMRL
jgi:glycerophosphoryl diester phosphodiesterase